MAISSSMNGPTTNSSSRLADRASDIQSASTLIAAMKSSYTDSASRVSHSWPLPAERT
jgi:hypothetical protein